MPMRRAFCLALLVALLGGCANRNPELYYWGGYQPQVYAYLKTHDGDHKGEILMLQKTVEKARDAGRALPPGFHAHLGMLYVSEGQLDLARESFEIEKTRFPESAVFMDFLLVKLGGSEKK